MTPAVALTFDDFHVGNWVAARPVLDEFGARVTFCVCHIHRARPRQITKLRRLQQDGHEIAFHSRNHPRLEPYLARHGLAHWLEHEIDAGVAEHHALGFPAESFSFPAHDTTPEAIAETARRFTITRAAGALGLRREQIAQRIYHRRPPTRAVNCIGICDFQHRRFPGWTWQLHLLDEIAQAGGIGVFVGHDIATSSKRHFHSTPEQLRYFLGAVRDRGLRFVTLREIGA